MKILLCAATEMEIAPTIQFLAKHDFDDVVVLITGVGLVAAAYSITKSVLSNKFEMILQAGVAGSLETSIALGKVVAVKRETIGDLGVQEEKGFRSLFDLNLLSNDLPPWSGQRLVNEHEIVESLGLPLVDGVTVNEISTDPQTIQHYRKHLNAGIETMEGAALHYVGLMEKIPFLQVRSLSNFIGERDKTKWQMKESILSLNKELQRLLTKFFSE